MRSDTSLYRIRNNKTNSNAETTFYIDVSFINIGNENVYVE